MRSINFATALLCGASTLAIVSSANAQTAASGRAATAVEEVVVTGSRVIQNGNNMPTPVTVVGMEDALRIRPSTVADTLNDLPQFSGSRTPMGNPNTGSTVQQGGGNTGANSLNLRNLGQLRTLILYDGHRMPPTSATGVTDVDQIPQQLLQRVDVVTGGVSAVYGSDAISGVVNFITDRSFNGIKAKAQYGVNGLGDDKSVNYGFAAGRPIFGDHGHVEISYEYRKNDGIGARSARDPNHETYSVQGNGTPAAPFFVTPNGRVQTSTFGGLIRSGVLSGMTFKQEGVLSPFIHGTPTIPGNATANEIGGDGVYYDTSLKAGLESHQAFGRFDYDFTDTIHGFVEVAYNRKLNTANVFWQNLNQLTISATDAYLAPAYQAQLAAAKQPSFTFSKQMMDAPIQATSNISTMKYVNSGLEGDLGKLKWDLGYVHGEAELIPTLLHNTNNAKRAASLDAVRDASGNIVCNVTITNPTLYPGCVPLNPFGPTSDSLAALNYFTSPSHLDVTTIVDDVTGSISGSPFSTWAGPVNAAVSGEWRKLSEGVTSTVPDGVLADCTGLRFNCVQGTKAATGIISPATATYLWSDRTAPRPVVSQTVSEGALEADVPLLKDVFLAQSFNLTGAVRYTNYSTKGAYWTWKVGVDWHVTDEVRLRGTRSRDIRAPTLDDLFSPTSITVGTGTAQDRLTGQTLTGLVTKSRPNPNLTAEVGNTWSGGLVYRPQWLSGFSLSVDYFNITVSNAIVAILAGNVTAANACNASLGTSAYCAGEERPLPYTNITPANNLTAIVNTTINLSEQHTEGADIEGNYTTSFLGRPAAIRLLTTYQPHILYVQPGLLTLDQAGAAFGNNGVTAAPIWRFTGTLRFQPIDNLTLDFQTRWRTSLHEAGDPTLVFSCCEIKPANFTNFAATYQIKNNFGTTELSLNVSNLFDQYGPHASPFTNLNPGQQYGYVAFDDPLGRAFTFGVRFRH